MIYQIHGSKSFLRLVRQKVVDIPTMRAYYIKAHHPGQCWETIIAFICHSVFKPIKHVTHIQSYSQVRKNMLPLSTQTRSHEPVTPCASV